MKTKTFTSWTEEELVNRYAEIGVAQFEALLRNQVAHFNRLYAEKAKIVEELAMRPGDRRRALMALYDHPNVQVRLNAAKSTLAVAPAAARSLIEAIAESNRFPQAGDAGMCLRLLDKGIFNPS